MEYYFIIFFIYKIVFISASIPNWNLDSLSVDLFTSSSTETYEYILQTRGNYVLKKEITKTNGKLTSVNKLTFNLHDPWVTRTVEFDGIESDYHWELGVERLVCPKGKFHPYNFYDNSYIIPPYFVEQGDWDLSCYKHDTGYFLLFYSNNGDYSLYYKKGDNAIARSPALSFDVFSYKFPEYESKGHNYAYKFPSIQERDGNLLVSGYGLTMNPAESQINGQEPNKNTVLTKAKSHTQAYIDDNYYFYYFTYNNVSDFSSGYSTNYLNLGSNNYAESFNPTKNDESPLSFVDNVEILEMKFISGTRDIYYKLFNKDKNTTYFGLVDIKENKVLYNIEADDVTFIPDSNGQMIAITPTSIYKVCKVKVGDSCSDLSECPNLLLDPDGNKCQANCDEGKIKSMPEGICIDKNLCDLNIYILNEDETECGLCKYFYPDGAKYRLISTSQCIDEIPNNSEYYNEYQKLLKCKTNYHLEGYQCLPDSCYELCETCSAVSNDINAQKCITCKAGYVLEDDENCVIQKTVTTIITTIPTTIVTTIPTTIITTIPTTIITTIPTTIITTIPTTIITTVPTTIITTIPTTIPTTIITTIPTTITTTIPTTITTTIPTTFITTIPTTISTTIATTIITTIPTTIITTIPTTIFTTIPTTIITTIPTTIITSIPTTVIFEECEDEKCLTCSDESNYFGLCLSCNEAKGYKKINYTTVLTEFYDCILNTSSKISKFFFNETTQEYRPCYKTCKKCLIGGDEYANHCLECELGYMFRPGDNPYNNCVVYSNFYYITPYDQYKALNTLQCPDESKYLVRNGDKNYCIYDCKADDTYKYLYNGECLKECPPDTINQNYVCKEIIDGCNLGEIQMDNKNNITQETTEVLIKTYISEFNYTNKHVSLHTNKNYQIIIYKDRDCISELSLEMPKVDFKDCYDKVKRVYQIEEDLIITIIDKKDKTNEKTYYSFFHPLSGRKLDAEDICKNETIAVTKNLTSKLSENEEKFELQTYLSEQGINIFDMNDPFYTDLCYDFDNPSDKDIPLGERITSVYPDVSLCDEGCQMDGIDLNTMTALCNCKFNDIANNNIIKDNAILESVVGEVFDIINSSNILVMTCYDYILDHFSNSIGGIISIVALAGHLVCSIFYFIYGSSQIKLYIYNIHQNFVSFMEKAGTQIKDSPPKRNIHNEKLQDRIKNNKKAVRFNEPLNNNNNNKRPHSPRLDSKSTIDKRKIRIDKPPLIDYDAKSTAKEIIMYRAKSSKQMQENLEKKTKKEKSEKNSEKPIKKNIEEFSLISLKSKKKSKNKIKDKYTKINIDTSSALENDEDYRKFFDEYLATSLDDLEYDDAIIKDQRTFCEYLSESLKEKQMIAFTFIASDPLKIRMIKIMLFILNVILYFVVIGLFYSEEYITLLYNLDDDEENFFSYIPRSIDKYIYTTLVSIIIGYLMDCFFVEEKKLKGILKREKDDLVILRREINAFLKGIIKRYMILMILILVILLLSFYYLLCFNYVYPKTQVEWVKSSITILIIMQLLSALKCVLETSLRFLSFKCKSEKLYKISRLLD